MNLNDMNRFPIQGTFLDVLRNRRSRRFGLGMKMAQGPLAYESHLAPMPLTEEEEALLAFAACGVTGYALGDLSYAPGQGGTILAGLLGRTIPSGDAIQAVALIISNDEETYYIKRPQDFDPDEIPEMAQLAEKGEYVEMYRRSRVKIKEGRVAPSLEPMINLNVNKWSLYVPGSTYFLPINEFTFLYINGVMDILNETTGAFIVDERNGFQPAGLRKFAKSRGGHLDDDPASEKTATIQMVESLVTEFVSVEQGMMIQNLALMTEAMGLGGFPHWAAHIYGWFEALGCSMAHMKATRYLGMKPALQRLAGVLKRDRDVPYALGLEKDGQLLLKPFCPPYYPTMEAAVRAVVELKFGREGIYREGSKRSFWKESGAVARDAEAPSEATVAATIAFCDYVYNRYGRFPCYLPPLRTVLGFQVNHVDLEFYERFYRPEALSETVRQHQMCWHANRTEGV